jgi:hypothetical protein
MTTGCTRIWKNNTGERRDRDNGTKRINRMEEWGVLT